MSVRNWLPTPQQMSDAAQLRDEAYTGITMRQALGMIALLGLIAGIIPFINNWIFAARVGAALPLARAAQTGVELDQRLPDFVIGLPGFLNPALVSDLSQTLAGLGQPLAGWLAAGLSSLGAWLNWPLAWLTCWVVYGALVMVVNKALGATVTLQRFYAATGYAAVPLLLTGLSPIPCLGPLLALVGVLWAALVYVKANQAIASFTLARAVLGVLLPLLLLIFVGLLLFGLSLIGLLTAAL